MMLYGSEYEVNAPAAV